MSDNALHTLAMHTVFKDYPCSDCAQRDNCTHYVKCTDYRALLRKHWCFNGTKKQK